MKEVTFSQQGENSRFREIVTFLKWLKIVLINSRLLQNPCESYLYLFRKYVCIIPLVSSYLAWFRFVSENRIRRIIAARHARSTPRHSMSRVFRWFTETISKQMPMALRVFYTVCVISRRTLQTARTWQEKHVSSRSRFTLSHVLSEQTPSLFVSVLVIIIAQVVGLPVIIRALLFKWHL